MSSADGDRDCLIARTEIGEFANLIIMIYRGVNYAKVGSRMTKLSLGTSKSEDVKNWFIKNPRKTLKNWRDFNLEFPNISYTTFKTGFSKFVGTDKEGHKPETWCNQKEKHTLPITEKIGEKPKVGELPSSEMPRILNECSLSKEKTQKKLFLVQTDCESFLREQFKDYGEKVVELTPSDLELLKSLVMNFEDDLERGLEDEDYSLKQTKLLLKKLESLCG